MSEYLVVGAGAVGTSVAKLLATQDHRVRVVTRSGSGPKHPLISRVSADASNADLVTEIASGCDAIFNCANPRYNRWPTDWPPIANSLLAAAERSGAVLTTLGNLYSYGRTTQPMSPDSPFLADYEKAKVRGKMWTDALGAHNAGRIRATEVRASDFIGPNAQGHMGDRVVPRLLSGKRCQVIGSTDQPHSWSYTVDVARTLITCAQWPEAWGRAWHASTNPPKTQQEVIDDLADLANVPRVKVSTVPNFIIKAIGLFNPLIRELPKTMYQFTAPFVIDDSATRRQFGIEPTPWPEVLRANLRAYQK